MEAFESIKIIPISSISDEIDSRFNIRDHLDQDNINAIASGIKENNGRFLGTIQVTMGDNGQYIVVDGLHRLAACKQLGLTEIPCEYIDKDKAEDWGLRANIVRKDAHPLEKLASFKKIKEKYARKHGGHKMSDEALGDLYGLKNSTVNDIMTLDKLDDDIKQRVIKHDGFSGKTLCRIARMKNREDQLKEYSKAEKKYLDKLTSQKKATKDTVTGKELALSMQTQITTYLTAMERFRNTFFKNFDDESFDNFCHESDLSISDLKAHVKELKLKMYEVEAIVKHIQKWLTAASQVNDVDEI